MLACVLVAFDASAQVAGDGLFTAIPVSASAQATSLSRAVVQRSTVGMQLDRLFGSGAGSRVRLNIPGRDWTAQLERIDFDIGGFRSWVGSIEGVEYSHMSVTERNGIVAGLINAITETFQIRTISPGVYTLEQIDTSRLGPELDPASPPGPGGAQAAPGNVDDANTIDVLFLYTPNAMSRGGGIDQMQAFAAQIISDSNTVFARSGVAPRLRLVGTNDLALTEGPGMLGDLQALSASPVAQALRDRSKADLVQLLVSSPDLSTCGIAWILDSLPNPGFPAYSVIDIACLAQYTPTHELAHNMGSHHAPEDNPFGGLFPYSYGLKDPVRGFRTVMAYQCAGSSCPRIPNMSNPLVSHSGGPTGSAFQNNTLSINNAAASVANFREAGVAIPPPTPIGLQSRVEDTSVTVWWKPFSSETSPPAAAPDSYILQAGTAPGLSNVFNASVGSVVSLRGVLPPGTYFWRVIALNRAGSSPASPDAQFTVAAGCTPPGPPHSFTFSLSGRTVTLNWVAPLKVGAPTTYLIEAGSAPALANLYNAPTGSIATTAVVVAPPGTYYVRIRAENSCGTSPASNEQVIVVP